MVYGILILGEIHGKQQMRFGIRRKVTINKFR